MSALDPGCRASPGRSAAGARRHDAIVLGTFPTRGFAVIGNRANLPVTSRRMAAASMFAPSCGPPRFPIDRQKRKQEWDQARRMTDSMGSTARPPDTQAPPQVRGRGSGERRTPPKLTWLSAVGGAGDPPIVWTRHRVGPGRSVRPRRRSPRRPARRTPRPGRDASRRRNRRCRRRVHSTSGPPDRGRSAGGGSGGARAGSTACRGTTSPGRAAPPASRRAAAARSSACENSRS